MNNKHVDKSMFHAYFSDFYTWNATVAALFIVSYTLELKWGGPWGRYWLIPACFVIMILISLKYYILFFTAVKDLKGNHIEEIPVRVQQIVRDKKFNFYNKGGAMVGREKCLLIDSDAAQYRVVLRRDEIVARHLPEYYSDAQVRIVYLSRSRIVLHMKMMSSEDATKHLHKIFYEYFA